MRILQVIDSFEVGGAEKMAINYANALSEKIEFSGIVATRKEGELKSQISSSVPSFYLNRKKTIDFKAIFKLRKICKEYDIEIMQPHSSSYFIAILVKFIYPKVKIIWHDHYGLSEFLGSRKSFMLKLASFYFKGIIVVNYQLKNWAIKELNCKKVIYLPNFTKISKNQFFAETKLKGIEGKRILCLANLREQKNHFLLLNVAKKLKISFPDWTFHLVGKDFNDRYSSLVKKEISENGLEKNVYIYGSRNDTFNILNQADICVLSSKSEGLPVSLLEYGLTSMPTVVTNVGEISSIINHMVNGMIVPSGDELKFYECIVELINDEKLRQFLSVNLHKFIIDNHSEKVIIDNYFNWLKTL